MELNYRVITAAETATVLEFEETRLKAIIPDEEERLFIRWRAKWRPESLDHYLKSGWSMGVFHKAPSSEKNANPETEQLIGYFLAQPLLFFMGQTQSLWIEYLSATQPSVEKDLAELAVGYAKDKHLQQVLFSDPSQHEKSLGRFAFERLGDALLKVRTTKSL